MATASMSRKLNYFIYLYLGDKYWGDPKRGLPLTHTAKMAAQLWMREKARTATKLQVHHIVEQIYRDSVVTNIKKVQVWYIYN